MTSRIDDILYAPIGSQDIVTATEVIERQLADTDLRTAVDISLAELPTYELTAQCFLYYRLYERGDCVIWNETPNHAMKPMNEAAKQRYSSFIASVGEGV